VNRRRAIPYHNAAIPTGLGFDHVSNLKDGMLAWDDQKLPVER